MPQLAVEAIVMIEESLIDVSGVAVSPDSGRTALKMRW